MPRLFATLALLLASASLFAQSQFDTYPVDEHDKTAPAELKERRQAIKTVLGSDAIGVFFTNPVRNRNNDVDFQFRGDSNFLYLTGFEEPDSALILAPGGIQVDGRRTTEILFVNEPDLASITWLGYRMGPANAEKLLGIEMALPNRRFAEVISAALQSGAKLTTGEMPDGPSGTVKSMMDALIAAKAKANPGQGPRVLSRLTTMRGVKSAYEIDMLKKACDVSARAHIEAMKSIRPGEREFEVAALMQYQFARAGCEYVGYPPICGSGPNSTILHYEANRRLMQAGDIFCMDSAGEYHGYSADVTRSFPVSGKFSPAQRSIYEVVYNAQETGISMCKPGSTFGQISNAVTKALADGLIKLGIIKQPNELGRYYMHGFGHGIGLDVHDPAPGTLKTGVCMTVEPGIYIKAGSPCDPKWWNIGIRIEDDILVTANGPVNMSGAAPRKWQDIEKVMAKR